MTEQTDAAEVDYAAFWWAQQSGETETWEQLNTEEREAVMENCYAETVADWLAARDAAAEARGAQAVLDDLERRIRHQAKAAAIGSMEWRAHFADLAHLETARARAAAAGGAE